VWILAEIHRSHEKRPQPFTIEDFLPKGSLPPAKPEDKSAAMLAQVAFLNEMFGGKDERKVGTPA
jgi:hypothetical protein